MGDDKTGLQAALEDAAGGSLTQGSPGAEEIEPDMFAGELMLGELVTDSGGRRAGPGRPKGSRNRNTKEWADYILKRYGSPLDGLGEVVTTPIAQLAKALACTKLEAAEFQRKCRITLAEYAHQKQPQAVQLNEQFAGALLVIDKSAGAENKIIDNQPLSASEMEKSHDD